MRLLNTVMTKLRIDTPSGECRIKDIRLHYFIATNEQGLDIIGPSGAPVDMVGIEFLDGDAAGYKFSVTTNDIRTIMMGATP